MATPVDVVPVQVWPENSCNIGSFSDVNGASRNSPRMPSQERRACPYRIPVGVHLVRHRLREPGPTLGLLPDQTGGVEVESRENVGRGDRVHPHLHGFEEAVVEIRYCGNKFVGADRCPAR